MSALVAFLLARFAEDEAAISEAFAGWTSSPFDEQRMLAEVEAKRRIIHEHVEGDAWCDYCGGGPGGDPDGCLTLRLLALPYADHADYLEEWKL